MIFFFYFFSEVLFALGFHIYTSVLHTETKMISANAFPSASYLLCHLLLIQNLPFVNA